MFSTMDSIYPLSALAAFRLHPIFCLSFLLLAEIGFLSCIHSPVQPACPGWALEELPSLAIPFPCPRTPASPAMAGLPASAAQGSSSHRRLLGLDHSCSCPRGRESLWCEGEHSG